MWLGNGRENSQGALSLAASTFAAMALGKAIRHLFEHVSRLGLAGGLRVLWLKKRGAGRLATLQLKQLAGPITLRTGGSDLAILDEIVIDRGYDFQLPEAPRIILDIGANIGLATLWFKRRYPDARIIAVEPDPESFALLERNTSGIAGIERLNAALTAVDGVIGLERGGLNPSAFHVRALRPGEEGVEAIRMPSLLARYRLHAVDLLKLDIEGAEKEVFEADDLSWMDSIRTIAVELHDRMKPGCGHAFFSAVTRDRRDYEVHEYLVIATKT